MRNYNKLLLLIAITFSAFSTQASSIDDLTASYKNDCKMIIADMKASGFRNYESYADEYYANYFSKLEGGEFNLEEKKIEKNFQVLLNSCWKRSNDLRMVRVINQL